MSDYAYLLLRTIGIVGLGLLAFAWLLRDSTPED
jgi:hypothetical protein